MCGDGDPPGRERDGGVGCEDGAVQRAPAGVANGNAELDRRADRGGPDREFDGHADAARDHAGQTRVASQHWHRRHHHRDAFRQTKQTGNSSACSVPQSGQRATTSIIRGLSRERSSVGRASSLPFEQCRRSRPRSRSQCRARARFRYRVGAPLDAGPALTALFEWQAGCPPHGSRSLLLLVRVQVGQLLVYQHFVVFAGFFVRERRLEHLDLAVPPVHAGPAPVGDEIDAHLVLRVER